MKKTIRDYELMGRKVIIRVDFNVPMKDGIIQDDTRVVASLKTIKYAIDRGAKIILFSHLGKVKEEADLEKKNLYPVSVRLSELLGKKVLFSSKTRGIELENMVDKLDNGDVLLVQNTRYEDLDGKKESGCDEELSKYWASLGDLFINDAYGTCHRAHASNVGISKYLPNGIGFLVEEEVLKLDGILNDDTRDFVVVMGGAKVHDKIKVIENLITKCDKLIIGGGMAYTFLKAKGYDIANSIMDEESLEFCKKIIEQYGDKIILPVDHVVSSSLESEETRIALNGEFLVNEMGLDIGPRTIELFCEVLRNAKRVILNGPMGCFENKLYQNGTKVIYDFVGNNVEKALIGGGDSVSAVNQLSNPELFYHISTGGGATLEYLEGTPLPGIQVINSLED